jgi:nucleotide-binding universal stress UspA family protein
MYRHLLIATDGSELADKAVHHGIALAKETGARITALTVSEPFHVIAVEPAMLDDTRESYEVRVNGRVARILAAVAERAKAASVVCETVHESDAHPYRAIIDTAQSRGCDLILMASHGRRGIAAVVLGSETLKVLTHSKIPVLVYR